MARNRKNKKTVKNIDEYKALLDSNATVVVFENSDALAYVFECDGSCENCTCKKPSFWQKIKALFGKNK